MSIEITEASITELAETLDTASPEELKAARDYARGRATDLAINYNKRHIWKELSIFLNKIY